jgi:hypothetical protein
MKNNLNLIKSSTNPIILVLAFMLVSSVKLQSDQDQTNEHFANLIFKCDIGYKVSFADRNKMPSQIEILIHDNNINKALNAFGKAPLENINDDLAKDSRVYFVWRSDNKEQSAVWSFAEKDGKIRIHDRNEKKGYWVDLAAFLKRVEEIGDGRKKVVFKR